MITSELKQIKSLLEIIIDRLESDSTTERPPQQMCAHNLIKQVTDVVDCLQPCLQPYELAIYMYLFRSSILGTGGRTIRVSTRRLQSGVITSRSGQSENLSYESVQRALQGLVDKGAIVKSCDRNRAGTLYKVNLPQDIPLCQKCLRMRGISKN